MPYMMCLTFFSLTILREYANPRVVIEELDLESGEEMIEPGQNVRVSVREVDGEFKVARFEHEFQEGNLTTRLNLGNPPRVMETTIEEIEHDLMSLERGR